MGRVEQWSRVFRRSRVLISTYRRDMFKSKETQLRQKRPISESCVSKKSCVDRHLQKRHVWIKRATFTSKETYIHQKKTYVNQKRWWRAGVIDNISLYRMILTKWRSAWKVFAPQKLHGSKPLHETKSQRFFGGESVFLHSKFQIREFHAGWMEWGEVLGR